MRFIDEHVGQRHDEGLRWGVESICVQLTELGAKIAPATYYEHRSRTPSTRQVRDAELKPLVAQAHAGGPQLLPAGTRPVMGCRLRAPRGALEPSRGGRPSLPGRRSGPVVAGGSLIREMPGRVVARPDNAGTCQHCQMVRVRRA